VEVFLKKLVRVRQHGRRLPGRDSDGGESARLSSGDITSGLRDAAIRKKWKEKIEAEKAKSRGVETVDAETFLRELRKRSSKLDEKNKEE